nr:S49 family peptidase [Candidatus Woesebacteria bacterium]
ERKIYEFFVKYRQAFAAFGIAVFFLGLVIAGVAIYNGLFDYDVVYYEQGDPAVELDGQGCNTLGLNLHGSIYTYIPMQGVGEDTVPLFDDAVASEDIIAGINLAQQSSTIRAIMLEVDSGGGEPVAGEEIANALRGFDGVTVSVIRQMGASAAYWAATGADRIFASQNSDVGGIGVTSSYVENIESGSRYINLSAGKFKDSGDPEKPITEEERNLFMRDINIIYENFIQAIAQNRNLEIEKVRALADGSTVLGAQAKEFGLIDEIGSWTEARKYLEQELGEAPVICWQ